MNIKKDPEDFLDSAIVDFVESVGYGHYNPPRLIGSVASTCGLNLFLKA